MSRTWLAFGALAVSVGCGASSSTSGDAATVADAEARRDAAAQPDAAACTCIAPATWNLSGQNTCDGPTLEYGCQESPRPFPRTFDRPPPCWQRTKTDPETGCLVPDLSGACAESCFGADAGPGDGGTAGDAGAGRVCGGATCAAGEVCCAATGPAGDQCSAPNACASVRCEGPEHCGAGTLCCTDGIQSVCAPQASCFDRSCRTATDCAAGEVCCPFGTDQRACRSSC